MAVSDIQTTSMAASTTIAVPSMPLPPGPGPAVVRDAVVDDDVRTDADLVTATRDGAVDAFEVLFNRWFERSWNVARTVVGHNETAAEVAQDAVLKAWQQLDDLDKPESFGSWLLSITRNRALDRNRRESRTPILDDVIVADLRDQQLQSGRQDWMAPGTHSVPEAVDSQQQQEMVWAASAALGAKDSALLDLHLRHGLTATDLAESSGGTVNGAHQQLFRLRRRLGDAVGAYVLWRGGTPLCQELDEVLPVNNAGVRYFDRSVAKLVGKHVDDCHRCGADRASMLDPAALFASIPLVAVPGYLQQAASQSLAARGVPVDPVPILQPNLAAMADVDSGLLLTRVVDGPKPPHIRSLSESDRSLLEDDYGRGVDLTADRPEWNPGPILSEAELRAPDTNPNVIGHASETRRWRLAMLSPAAMVGIGVGLALTVMAVAMAARPEPSATETASGSVGGGVAAGEESAAARTVISGSRAEADGRLAEVTNDPLTTSSAIEDSSSVTASYGAAVPVGDDDDKLVARSAAGAALLTTDEDTGDTALRDLQEVLIDEPVLAETDVVSGTVAAPSTIPSVNESVLGDVETVAVQNDDDDDRVDVNDDDDFEFERDDDESPTTSATTQPVTSEPPATDPRPTDSRPSDSRPSDSRPTDPPGTTVTTVPVTTSPPTTASPSTTETPATDPRPTAPATTAPSVDDVEDDDIEVDDDDVDDIEVDDDDVEEDEPGDVDDVVVVDDSTADPGNGGGSPSGTRPTRDENPSDTRPGNSRRNGAGN